MTTRTFSRCFAEREAPMTTEPNAADLTTLRKAIEERRDDVRYLSMNPPGEDGDVEWFNAQMEAYNTVLRDIDAALLRAGAAREAPTRELQQAEHEMRTVALNEWGLVGSRR